MSRRNGSGNQLAFNDMLFNVLLGFVVLFVIAFLLINPITKKQDIPAKSEFMIIMEWDDDSESDIDLWTQRENYIPIGFNNKSGMGLNLERDDLGQTNDMIRIDGVLTPIKSNREVLNIRGIVPGNYYINIHAYSWREEEGQTLEVTVIVTDINPSYREIYNIKVILSGKNQVQRLPAFTVTKDGNIKTVFNHTRNIVPNRK